MCACVCARVRESREVAGVRGGVEGGVGGRPRAQSARAHMRGAEAAARGRSTPPDNSPTLPWPCQGGWQSVGWGAGTGTGPRGVPTTTCPPGLPPAPAARGFQSRSPMPRPTSPAQRPRPPPFPAHTLQSHHQPTHLWDGMEGGARGGAAKRRGGAKGRAGKKRGFVRVSEGAGPRPAGVRPLPHSTIAGGAGGSPPPALRRPCRAHPSLLIGRAPVCGPGRRRRAAACAGGRALTPHHHWVGRASPVPGSPGQAGAPPRRPTLTALAGAVRVVEQGLARAG